MTKTNESTEAILKAGKASGFWNIICKEIDKEIKKCEQERDSDSIAAMPIADYKTAMENVKDRIAYLKSIKEFPNTIIQNLDNPVEETNPDPYDE